MRPTALLVFALMLVCRGLRQVRHFVRVRGDKSKKGNQPKRSLMFLAASSVDEAQLSEWLFDEKIPLDLRKLLQKFVLDEVRNEKDVAVAVAVAAKDVAVAVAVAEKDVAVAAKDVAVAVAVAEKDVAVAAKDVAVAVAAKDVAVAVAVAEKDVAVAEKDAALAKQDFAILQLETAMEKLMDTTSALNPRAVLEFIEVKHMPHEYAEKKLPRKDKWEKYLSTTDPGIALFHCLKRTIPDWDSTKKVATNFSNIYNLASQFAHCTSSSIAADPSKAIRLSGPLLPQTLLAMACISKSFDLKFKFDKYE